ncbi:uncharacterized protein BT62DRAFT_932507 [Guyanagaster necrorhizus]|uniref:Uncharacterized protein n=1 Tax=Guyanagaster necrorhizus TaxID=856835 RepID=A0A9P7VRL1_9AGAR|nr:uncharacterized protein BT62DRAFT_932507 [Guyanagaster necrorhizus MCA 3950]KAG7446143.1 hypothetical protein BT62DRAFT_932507 [Guyanagaster necrorhizus MCA 3950]
MAAANDSLATLPISAPYPPSPVEARCFYYGLPSRPTLVARSSADIWVEPMGPEAYLIPKESSPVGLHPLREIWEATVGPAMIDYLDFKGVKMTSLDPVRMGYVDESSPPVIIWMGVVPGSLSAKDGVEVATHCKNILSAYNINDVHVEIRESEISYSAGPKMYRPFSTYNATAQAQEPFSTALGLPICAKDSPTIEGTGGFFISDPRNPGKIYLVTARHVVFHSDRDSNELYQHCNSSQPHRDILLFGDAAIEKYINAIEFEIGRKHMIIEDLWDQLEYAKQKGEKNAVAKQKHVLPQLEEASKAIRALKKFLADVSRDWKKQENRVLGHIVLSPPISFGVGEEGFMEDWAVIEIDDSKINLNNFVGNVIDLGTTIPVEKFTVQMFPDALRTWVLFNSIDPSLSRFLENYLLKFDGTISDEEMWKPSWKTVNHDNDPCIMVIKRGYASDLTIGRLNTIRSFTRFYLKGQPIQTSRVVTILPFNSESHAFSSPGDSGSAVVDGKGRLAGLLTGGAGDTEEFDCTYLTSINFLLKCMLEHGLKANLSPSLNA